VNRAPHKMSTDGERRRIRAFTSVTDALINLNRIFLVTSGEMNRPDYFWPKKKGFYVFNAFGKLVYGRRSSR